MSLTAIIPVRLGLPRKTRLSERLLASEREALADRLFSHVLSVVSAHPSVGRTIILSPLQPSDTAADWRLDQGRGFNAELENLRRGLTNDDLLVVHGDLPLLAGEDVGAMIDAMQESGIGLAPDRLDEGTNAVALRAGTPFAFAFGSRSFPAHLDASGGNATLVRRLGLALDIDSPDDLDAAEREGFTWSRGC